MLSLQTVLPDTLELLKTLMNQPLLYEMRLVGGTSLALQYGHRRSVDLDFFGTCRCRPSTNAVHVTACRMERHKAGNPASSGLLQQKKYLSF